MSREEGYPLKKNVFCAGVLALWFLLFCTFFSLRVEDMMTPRVVAVQPSQLPNSTKSVLSLEYLFPNEDGQACLYSLYEGIGWEEGPRAALTPPALYEIDLQNRNISIAAGGQFIGRAAKSPQLGEEVLPITAGEPASDRWLALCPSGTARLKELTNGAEIEAQTDHSLLVSIPDGPSPFAENQARSRLFTTTALDSDPETVYSLNDVESFLSQILLLSGLGALLLFTVILWAGSCRLLKKPEKYKLPLLLNGALFLLSTIALPLLLNAIDLPQSLLPGSVIVDIPHYRAEFGAIFSALRQLAEEGSQTAQDLLSRASVLPFFSAAILFAGIFAACALLFAVVVLFGALSPRGKHAAHTKR